MTWAPPNQQASSMVNEVDVVIRLGRAHIEEGKNILQHENVEIDKTCRLPQAECSSGPTQS